MYNTAIINNHIPVKKLLTVLGMAILVWWLLTPMMLSAYAALGDYISEKTLGSAGSAASLQLGSTGDTLPVLGTEPIVSTIQINNSTSVGGVIAATLRGNLTNLNGMPRADVWFVWGYAPGTLSNTTATNTVTTTGEQTANITGLNPGDRVYYQFRAGTDGTATGTTLSFLAGGGHGVSYWMLQILLPIIIAVTLFVFVFTATGNPLVALIGSVIGLIAFNIVQAIAGIL